ncbi:hypothetical protein, partial [Bifidobacterium apri]
MTSGPVPHHHAAHDPATVRYRAVAVPQSVSGRTRDVPRAAEQVCDGHTQPRDNIRSIYLKLPEITRAALVMAQGALERTLYTASDGHDTAFLLGYHR